MLAFLLLLLNMNILKKSKCFAFFSFFFFGGGSGFEHSASHLLGRYSTALATPPAQSVSSL
jgi:methyl coenzyme M reductase beta subunit